jgi:hypothetical protein
MYDDLLAFESGEDCVKIRNVSLVGFHAFYSTPVKSRQFISVRKLLSHNATNEPTHTSYQNLPHPHHLDRSGYVDAPEIFLISIKNGIEL